MVNTPYWFVVNRTPQADFIDPVEDMLQEYLKMNWGMHHEVIPERSTDPPFDYSSKLRFGDFEYDYYSTYYIRVREGDTEIVNDLPEEGGKL